jgi:hypothetical protein
MELVVRSRREIPMEGQGYDGINLYGDDIRGCSIVSAMLRGLLDLLFSYFGVLIWESTLVWCLFV